MKSLTLHVDNKIQNNLEMTCQIVVMLARSFFCKYSDKPKR